MMMAHFERHSIYGLANWLCNGKPYMQQHIIFQRAYQMKFLFSASVLFSFMPRSLVNIIFFTSWYWIVRCGLDSKQKYIINIFHNFVYIVECQSISYHLTKASIPSETCHISKRTHTTLRSTLSVDVTFLQERERERGFIALFNVTEKEMCHIQSITFYSIHARLYSNQTKNIIVICQNKCHIYLYRDVMVWYICSSPKIYKFPFYFHRIARNVIIIMSFILEAWLHLNEAHSKHSNLSTLFQYRPHSSHYFQ